MHGHTIRGFVGQTPKPDLHKKKTHSWKVKLAVFRWYLLLSLKKKGQVEKYGNCPTGALLFEPGTGQLNARGRPDGACSAKKIQAACRHECIVLAGHT
jgi:hypothetical protein